MNRRLAVLGLAVAMCGTGSVVAGQTAQKDAPVNPELLQQDAPVNPELLQQDAPVVKLGHINPPTTAPVPTELPLAEWRDFIGRQQSALMARAGQAQQGQTTFRVESVGPKLMRVHLTTDGVEQGTLESTGFTIATGANGTTITASGPVTMATSDGKKLSFEGLTLQLTLSGKYWFALRQ
jgi:hypothetical protein